MTKSIRSIKITVRLDFIGHDLSDSSIKDALEKMNYSFEYEDDYAKIINSEVTDTFVE